MRNEGIRCLAAGLLAGTVWGAPGTNRVADAAVDLAEPGRRLASVRAVATGIPEGDPVEFLLIGENSGHDYESIAVARCEPSFLHRALAAAGFEPGRPADPSQRALWPRGDAVRIEFEWEDADGAVQAVEARKLVRSTVRGDALEDRFWLFTGSEWIEPSTGLAERAYAADLYSPNALISLYNTSLTVLDRAVPAPQSPLYGTLYPSGAVSWTNGQPLTVRFTRPPAEDRRPAADALLEVAPASTGGVSALRDASFSLKLEGEPPRGEASLPEVVEELRRLEEGGTRVYLDLRFDPALPLSVIRAASLAMAAVEDAGGARVEPPGAGQLYYRAFLPAPELRDMDQRPAQPWELHLESQPEGLRASLRKIREEWTDGASGRFFDITEFPLDQLSDAEKLFEREGPGMPVLLVYAPDGLAYGRLLEALAPAQETHPTVFVFLTR
jgi:hypothetical protein